MWVDQRERERHTHTHTHTHDDDILLSLADQKQALSNLNFKTKSYMTELTFDFVPRIRGPVSNSSLTVLLLHDTKEPCPYIIICATFDCEILLILDLKSFVRLRSFGFTSQYSIMKQVFEDNHYMSRREICRADGEVEFACLNVIGLVSSSKICGF